MTEATPEEQPQGQPIVDEAAFARELGLNPDQVMSGSIKVEFTPQGAVVSWTSRVIVPPQIVGLAFMAGSGAEIRRDGDAEDNVQPIKQPSDRKKKKS